MIKWVKVKFQSGHRREYSYLCDIQNVRVGDMLVVDAQYSGICEVECTSVQHGEPPRIASKYIMHKAHASVRTKPKGSVLNDYNKAFGGCTDGSNTVDVSYDNEETEMKGMENFSNKMMDRFFRKVDGVKWDLMSGRIGVVLPGEGIVTLDGVGDDAGTVINIMEEFGMPVPAFAQNTPLNTVNAGDLIYQAGTVKGWVTEVVYAGGDDPVDPTDRQPLADKTVSRFKLLTPSGNATSWKPPKVSMMGSFDSGVMVLRSLLNMLPGSDADAGAGLKGMQNMLLPMMMMGGGGDAGIENMMPMLLFSQLGADGSGNDAMGGNNMLQTMMMMKMFSGSGGGTGGFFD
jgi:hypothetical protein